ncbi:MAG: carboxypeptidase regulatory-like domain-containing protein [Anaerolineae bacterium]
MTNNSTILSKILVSAAIFTAALFWFLSSVAPAANAHGTSITYATTLTVQGAFESGEPMSNAEVTIFTPTDPQNAWGQGIADEEGRYTFTPDASIEGEWTVSYRSAGHGDIAYIPVGEGVTGSGGGLTGNLQRIVMAVAVIWGFVGTALYFQSKQKTTGS